MTSHNIDRKSPEWAPVAEFFGSCLHQDYDAEHDTGWEAVCDFVAGVPPERLQPAVHGIRHLLATFEGEHDLVHATYLLGLGYYPPADGYTYRGWLEEVADFLESQR